MDTILLLAHTEADGTLPKAAYEALTAAKNLARDLKGATLAAGLIGADVAAAAGTLTGIERVLGVSGAEFAVSRYASDVAAAAALVSTSGATIVVAPASTGTILVILAQPALAAAIYTFLVAWNGHPDLGRPAPSEPSEPSAPSESTAADSAAVGNPPVQTGR